MGLVYEFILFNNMSGVVNSFPFCVVYTWIDPPVPDCCEPPDTEEIGIIIGVAILAVPILNEAPLDWGKIAWLYINCPTPKDPEDIVNMSPAT